ncbi:MAG TPA: TonB-dependent receptor [Rhizomicrobium sp.]|nr:TonB-dependent receptor [Rhizomicrobium sp.]
MAADDVETVVVTGSRIPQQGLYSSSPVTAVGQQEFKFQGTTNVENLLNSLPTVFADQGQTASNAASGTASVNLRDLGPKRTLVLVDGKRLMPGDPDPVSHGTGGVADLNVIPAALVDHVEVLTGGASATYGSDALAGVVNFIMRKDFEGVELDGQYSVTNNTNTGNFPGVNGDNAVADAGYKFPKKDILDGATDDATLLIGANSANGKGNVTMYLGYEHIQPILENARDFSDCAAASGYTYFYCGGSSTVPEGKFTSIDAGAYNLTIPGQAHPGPECLAIDPHTGKHVCNSFFAEPNHSFSTSNPGTYNYAPYNYLQRPDTRYTAGGFAHYELNKQLDIYSSVMFMDDHTIAQVAPGGAFQTPFLVNCDNPLMTASQESFMCPAGATPIQGGPAFTGVQATDTGKEATVLIGRRSVEAGNRIDDLRHTDYRLLIGARGDLGDGWSYDMSAQYGVSIYADNQLNYFSNNKFQNALQVVNKGGTPTCISVINNSDPACVPVQVFQAPIMDPTRSFALSSPLTQAQLDYVNANGEAIGQTNEELITAAITGNLGAWGIQSPGAKSPVAVSFGTEYREEGINYQPDGELRTGDLMGLGGQRAPVSGHYNVAEGFGEVRVPIIQDQPFFEDLSINAGYRYSSYSTVGSTNTYKYGAEWQPVDDFRLRASFQHAVRAPNTAELFASPAVILFGGQDPCANNGKTNAPPANTAALRAFCQNTGLVNFGTGGPGDKYGAILPCPASQCNQLSSGNINLTPEDSDTKSLGFVFTPTFISGFTATIDYFDIRVNKTVGTFGAAFLLASCKADILPACGLIHRDPVTGFIWTPNGYVENPSNNLGFLQTKGIDLEAGYQAELSDWGMGNNGGLAFNLVGTWTQHLTTEAIPPDSIFFSAPATYDCAGLFGLTCGTPVPKWRHKLRVTWSSPWDFDLSLAWRYMSSVTYDANSTNPHLGGGPALTCPDGTVIHGVDCVDNRIDAFNYFDLAGNWNVREGVSLRAGVNNIFDKGPPILSSGVAFPPFGNGNTYPEVYDGLGRVFFVGATIKN